MTQKLQDGDKNFFGIESHNFVNINPVLIKFGYNNLRSSGFRMH